MSSICSLTGKKGTMSKFKAPFSKGFSKNAQLQTSEQELPPLKIGKTQILTPGTKKKILKRLAHNIQTKARTVLPVSPGISLSVQFDSQSDASTAANPAEIESQNLDDEIHFGEEFDLELSPSKNKLDQLNTLHRSKFNILDNRNAADDYKPLEDAQAKEGEIINSNEESAKQPESANNAYLQNNILAMDKDLLSRMSIAEPKVNSEFYDYLHQSDLMDELQDSESQNKKVQRKFMIKARSMNPRIKKKIKKHSSVKSRNTVNQKGKKEIIPSRKIKDNTVTQENVNKTTQAKNKQFRNSKTFMKVKNLKSAHFEALDIDQRNKSKRSKSSKGIKSKKEVKDDVMKMIQKMHKEIVQLLDRRTKMLKAQEKTNVPYFETVAIEE